MDTEDDALLQDVCGNEDEEGACDPGMKTRGSRLCGKCQWNPRRQATVVTLPSLDFWTVVGWVFTNPYSASLILFLGCAIPAGLALTMFLHYPALDIDISYNAFEIRNHESSQHFDALTLALKSQFGLWGRSRRDLADFSSETLRRLIFEKLQHLQRNASRPGGPSLSRRQRRDTGRNQAGPANHTSHQSRSPLPRWEYPSATVSANTQTHAHWRIELIFLARGDAEKNIFTSERLLTIHEVEHKIMDHPHFQEFCWKPHEVLKDLPLGSYSYCSPPSSLMTYFFPTERGGKIYYDGLGQELADIQGSLELAMTHPEFYWYVDEGLSAENKKSSLLRSEVLFGAPLPSYYSMDDRWEEQCRKFQNFVVTYVALLAEESTSKVEVLYGGTDLFDYEVRRIFKNDMLLAFISSSCIAVLVYLLASCSVFLSFFGIASIGISCLVALFLYHIVFGIQYLGILNGVAAFVIVGIGVDDVFVFINTYRQATHLKDLNLRMIYTIQTAGKATFFTSLTTAAAYAANIFSQIPAVHDFGLFMSLIVSCCWVGVLFTMPAALGIWSLYWSSLENTCQARCSKKCTKESALQSSDGLFVSLAVAGRSGLGPLPYLDDDIPLLNVEEEPVALEMGDVPLVSVLPENHHLTTNNDSPGHLITHLQKLLQCWALWSAVKNKWVIVGLFVLVLILSIFFASRLRPASRAPLLFRPDTNIQVLMDLKYNLSAEGISCVTCSGLFQEKPRNLQNNIRTSLEKKKRGSGPPGSGRGSPLDDRSLQDPQGTVYIFRSKGSSRPVIYRFSLNATVPAPWQTVPAKDGEVPSFQVYKVPYGNFTKRLTACMSTVGHVQPGASKKWMMTSLSCDTKRGWKSDFSFYVATQEQQRTRKLYFAQSHKPPYHSRVCLAPPGCLLSSSPDGPNKGYLFVPSERASSRSRFSITSGFNPCRNGNCGKPAVRPLVDTGAMVFVVFGILGVNRTHHADNHVIGDMGSVIYDSSFDLFKEIGNLCRICKAIASNAELVKPGGAQCLPSGYSVSSVLQMLHPECKSLPEPNLLPGQLSHGTVGVKDGKVQWISMAFESTTYKGKSSFQTYSDYRKWETFLQEQIRQFPEGSSLRRGFQTCEHWKQIFMEIIGVQSALFGLILSLVICIAAVALFTTHLLLLLPVLLTILGVPNSRGLFGTRLHEGWATVRAVGRAHPVMLHMGTETPFTWPSFPSSPPSQATKLQSLGTAVLEGLWASVVCLVVTVMYWSGWEIGAVEAVSLSILVGSSVDYCVHLVEGFLLAGESLPPHLAEDPSSSRQWRMVESVRHVGVAVVSSAVTTVIATVPLFFCIIAPFAKFGKIVALNTGLSIFYTLTVSTALLSIMGPPSFTRSRTSFVKALLGVLLAGVGGLGLYLVLLRSGLEIPLLSGAGL